MIAEQEVADSLKRVATDGAEAFRRDKDLFLENVGTDLNMPEHAKPRKEFHARGGIASPDKVGEGGSDAAMHAKFEKGRAVQTPITHRAASKGAAISGRGKLDLTDESEKRQRGRRRRQGTCSGRKARAWPCRSGRGEARSRARTQCAPHRRHKQQRCCGKG
jgi:hypothetical protein